MVHRQTPILGGCVPLDERHARGVEIPRHEEGSRTIVRRLWPGCHTLQGDQCGRNGGCETPVRARQFAAVRRRHVEVQYAAQAWLLEHE